QTPQHDQPADDHQDPGPDGVPGIEELGVVGEDEIGEEADNPPAPEDVDTDHDRRNGGERYQPRAQRRSMDDKRFQRCLVLGRDPRRRVVDHPSTPRSPGPTSAVYGKPRSAIFSLTTPEERSNSDTVCTTRSPASIA